MPPLKPPRPDRHAAIEVNAARGPHTPPPPPAREKLDSREVTQETLLAEYKGEADARRAAEARASELELKLAAAESGVTAYGPKVQASLGSAKWWAMIIGALAIAVPQVKEVLRPSASAAQIAAVQVGLTELGKRLDTRDAALVTLDKADARRWTISAAFLCSQGFRARGLDCPAAQAFADIQSVPLVPKGKPEWKAGASWPTVPIPPSE